MLGGFARGELIVRFIWASVLLTFSSVIANAQTRIDRIEITEAGIYKTELGARIASPGTASGTRGVLTNNIRLVAPTTTVSAKQGVHFGFRYKLVGPPAGATASIHFVTIFPPPGLQNPAKPRVSEKSEYDFEATAGQSNYKDYSMDEAWEVVPGVWKFQIWYQGSLMAEQAFTLVK